MINVFNCKEIIDASALFPFNLRHDEILIKESGEEIKSEGRKNSGGFDYIEIYFIIFSVPLAVCLLPLPPNAV